MLNNLSRLLRELHSKLHAFAIGTTIALGTVLFGQTGASCVASGQ